MLLFPLFWLAALGCWSEAKVWLQLSTVSARSDHAVPLRSCATRASATTCTDWERV